MRFGLSLLFLIFFFIKPIFAALPSIPIEVAAYIDGMNRDCREFGTPTAPDPGFLTRAHLRDAAHVDWIIHELDFRCQGALTIFVGNSGGYIDIFETLSENHARLVYHNAIDDMHVDYGGKKDRLWLSVGGGFCGDWDFQSEADAVQCDREVIWDRKVFAFDLAPLSEAKITWRPPH